MRILVLSFYYPPDIGPGPLRAEGVVEGLLDITDQVDVVSTYPNRYASYKPFVSNLEESPGISIRRVNLPAHRGGMIDQSRAFLIYARFVRSVILNQKWNVVYVTSSRLMTAVLGAFVAKKCDGKLYMDIRDLFSETMTDIFSTYPLKLFIPCIRLLEKLTLRRADRINVVSAGFVPFIKKVAPGVPVSVYTNGIDNSFIDFDFSKSYKNEIPLVVYAGNIGAGQGLHSIIPKVATLFRGKARFRIVGSGAQESLLSSAIKTKNLDNVEVLSPVSRDDLFDHYRAADVLFLHLNSYKSFHNVLPSKIFEYGSIGKPILAGVSGYAAAFMKKHLPDAQIFNPCDENGMKEALLRIIGDSVMIDRSKFHANFRRKNISNMVAREIVSLSNKQV